MSLQIILLFAFLLLLVYLTYERIRFFQLFKRLGVPGPTPNFFTGNMMELTGKGKLLTETMTNWEAEFGLVYGYFRGIRATLVVREPELIKEILVKNSADFINRPHMVMSTPPLLHTLVGLRDQRWKEVRNTLSPTFSGAKIKKMLPTIYNCMQTTIEILQDTHRNSGGVVNAHRLFQGLACDVICACALAMKVNAQRDGRDKFFVAVKGFLENAMGPFVKAALCFPLLAKVLGWALETFGYSHEMTKMIMSSVRTAMKIRRGGGEGRKEKLRNGYSEPEDVLQFMMNSTVPEHSSSPSGSRVVALSDDEVVANAWVFILGGFETTSAAMTYTCYLLSIHQDVQDKLFTELSESFGIDDIPTHDQLAELTLLDQVICESLRLYPPVVSFIVRGLEKECQIGSYRIPQHVGIQIPAWQIHHDPKLWREPYKFDPDRFSNNAKKAYANNLQWIPFGFGPRSCIGARFALMNLKFTLSTILRKFKVVQASHNSPQKLKLKIPSVTIVPVESVPLKFIPRVE